MSIVHLKEPRQASGNFNVLSVTQGQITPAGISLIGEGSYGDWTGYVVRQMQGATGTIPSFVRAKIVVGHQGIAVDAQIMPNVFLAAQSLLTWSVYHAVCSEFRIDISIDNSGGAKPQSDRVVAWIAPGRPSMNYVRHQLLNNTDNPIPTFAVVLEVNDAVIDTDTIEWYDAAGNLVETTFLTTAVVATPVSVRIPIPSFAAFVRPLGLSSANVLWHVYA